jgi:hypothetical protein
MRSASIAIAVLLACGSPALADPPHRPSAASHGQRAAHTIVLASAKAVRTQASEAQPASAPAPHRIARVTTCRCGDPQPGDVPDDSSDR